MEYPKLVIERYDDPDLGTFDETSNLRSSYLLLGAPIFIAGTDVEFCVSYHLVDLLFAKGWIGLTAGINM